MYMNVWMMWNKVLWKKRIFPTDVSRFLHTALAVTIWFQNTSSSIPWNPLHAHTIIETQLFLCTALWHAVRESYPGVSDSYTTIIMEQIKSALIWVQQAGPGIFYCPGQTTGVPVHSLPVGDINQGFVVAMRLWMTDILEKEVLHVSEKHCLGWSALSSPDDIDAYHLWLCFFFFLSSR